MRAIIEIDVYDGWYFCKKKTASYAWSWTYDWFHRSLSWRMRTIPKFNVNITATIDNNWTWIQRIVNMHTQHDWYPTTSVWMPRCYCTMITHGAHFFILFVSCTCTAYTYNERNAMILYLDLDYVVFIYICIMVIS